MLKSWILNTSMQNTGPVRPILGVKTNITTERIFPSQIRNIRKQHRYENTTECERGHKFESL